MALEQDWINLFLQYLIVDRHYSPETQKAYQADIKAFVDFLAANGGLTSFKQVGTLEVQTYLNEMDQKNIVAKRLRAGFQVCGRFIATWYATNFYRLIRLKRSNSRNNAISYPVFSMKKKWMRYLPRLWGKNR